MHSDNFRRIDSNFEVSKPFQEVIRIISFKAKHNGIKIEQVFEFMQANKKIRFDERRLI